MTLQGSFRSRFASALAGATLLVFPCSSHAGGGLVPPTAEEIAEAKPADPKEGLGGGWWLFGGQVTGIAQVNTPVPGAYYNPALSFGPDPTVGWSLSLSVFGGVSPWKGAALVVMPEYANGAGFPNASGIASYPNGDIVRVPSLGKEPYLARVFFHQDIPLDGTREPVTSEFEARMAPTGDHYLGLGSAPRKIEITIGKFAMNDFFDVSEAATDPRHNFMNWALMEQGAWDYAADTRGYTYGAVVGLEMGRWAVRAAVAMMPKVANGPDLDWDLAHAREEALEGEVRWSFCGQPGSAKLLGFINQAHAGRYADAIAAGQASGTAPDIIAVEKVGALKYGGGLLIDQTVAGDAHLFARGGLNDGQTETFAFTEIDRSISAGGYISGRRWKRAEDELALGLAVSGLSDEHAKYLAAGGHGFQLGDGALSYGWETVIETYYMIRPLKYFELTADAQLIVNPGMNTARGPVGVFGLRFHAHL